MGTDQLDDYESTTTWQAQAEWLHNNGYGLVIKAIGHGIGMGIDGADRWMSSIGIEGERCYAPTIGEAIEQVYRWVTSEKFETYRKQAIANRDYHSPLTHNCTGAEALQQVHDHIIICDDDNING